ncbi:family 15 glycosyl hydrolase [Colletotrichum cereale]|nr:family 15 glycosyl hydrolase [Colletotrichum cereale]
MAQQCSTRHAAGSHSGYLPIEDYGMIGNMHTCALVGMNGSVDFMCWPDFDSPSVFCRLLDKDKGGFFSICPPPSKRCTTKQQYLPSSNILQTRYIHDDGVVDLVDFFPRPKTATVLSKGVRQTPFRETIKIQEELKKWLVRRVECIRGRLEMEIEIFPAFQYATEAHVATIVEPYHTTGSPSKAVIFHSEHYKMQLDVIVDAESETAPTVTFRKEKRDGMLGEGVVAHLEIEEGHAISFVLRNDIPNHVTENITTAVLDSQQHDTATYWYNWISKSKYKGRWREVVNRSLMLLKMMTYEPTGAIIAAPTFSIPEDIGGVRNWDYRFSWVRDSSFTIYILLRLGFTAEADAYMNFISERFIKSRGPNGELPIMFTIRGETDIPEVELDHLEGYRGSKPVRIGNGAAYHQQFDIYGELMDGIYLYNKYGKPISWDQWCSVREMLDFVLTLTDSKFRRSDRMSGGFLLISPIEPDMSIWEVRTKKQNFTYSKVMLWVAFDRGLRLADKRNFPCPNRGKWLAARDGLMEEIMDKGYNKEMKCFVQSYENNTMVDSSILIAPLVFFIAPNDPRFLNTMDRILLPPEKGGLTSTGLVYRYNTELSEDGVGGREGAFSMCTFWLVEAMTRASAYEPKYLVRAVNLFENMLGFSNHLSMFSEEIARSGEQLGNTPQAFSHLALISAAFNLDRVTEFNR